MNFKMRAQVDLLSCDTDRWGRGFAIPPWVTFLFLRRYLIPFEDITHPSLY